MTKEKRKCKNCDSIQLRIEKYTDDYGFEREKVVCVNCGQEEDN